MGQQTEIKVYKKNIATNEWEFTERTTNTFEEVGKNLRTTETMEPNRLILSLTEGFDGVNYFNKSRWRAQRDSNSRPPSS